MRLIRYDYPATADLERYFGALFPTGSRCNSAAGCPTADLSEDATNYYVKVELPGVKKEDVAVELDNSVLTVTAKRAVTTAEGEKVVEFQRTFDVPEGVDATKIQAAYENGLLTLTLAKPEVVKPRRIDVR
jgi:HSP20 family protein